MRFNLYDAAVDLADRRAAAEVDCVAAVLPDTAQLVPIAEAEGVDAGCFEQYDLRLIWCAADVARDRPLIDVLKLARRALEADGHWNPDAPIGTGSKWSNESLVKLATSWPRSTVAARANAHRLVRLSRRWAVAERLLDRLQRVFSDPTT